MQNKKVFLGVLAMTVFLASAIVGFAVRRPDYSHVRDTISELGEYGAADSHLVGWGVFLPVGLGLAVVAVVALRAGGSKAACALAASVAIGYLVAAFFPCDPGSPLSGTGRQAIHNLGGAVEYFGGAFSLVLLARSPSSYRWIFASAAVVSLAVAIGLSVPDLAGVRGVLQRVGELSLFGSIALAMRSSNA